MEITELVDRKRELENKILVLLKDFQNNTGVMVRSIDNSWGATKRVFEEGRGNEAIDKKVWQFVTIDLEL